MQGDGMSPFSEHRSGASLKHAFACLGELEMRFGRVGTAQDLLPRPSVHAILDATL